ncbi:MAG TPA: hypothetical protein VE981_09935 [Planctomycetota bacterium]|nr:hypothetical protein [Planctomycetota bacterium]
MRAQMVGILLLALLAELSGVPLVQAGDEPKKESRKPEKMSLDSFKLALRDAKSIDEKALLLHAFGMTATWDAPTLAEVCRFINATPSDTRLLLPTTAVSILSRLRGNRLASQSLIQALPVFKKSPYLQKKILAGLAQVGHESAIPALEEFLRGNNEDLALHTVGVARELPADASLDLLFRSWDWMEGRKARSADPVKTVYERVGGEILKQVQAISGEKYPSMAELWRWWNKHAAEWKEKSALRERELEKQRVAVDPVLPPVLLMEFLFNDRAGTAVLNGGASSIWCPSASLTKVWPAWSAEFPVSGGITSLDWGKDGGPYAVDLAGGAEYLKGLKSFTVTGWIDCRSAVEGKGGNRIVSWLDRDGVEIVLRADGSLQVGINQKAEDSEVRTPSRAIPPIADGVPNAVFDSWRFFAVTCDTTTASGDVKVYIGDHSNDAALRVGKSIPVKAGNRVATVLSVGNVPPAQRSANPGTGFRGLIDEIRIFGSTWDGSGALSPAAIVKIQNRT